MPNDLMKLLKKNSQTFEEATTPQDIVEYTEEEMAVMNLGIEHQFVRIWYKHGPGKENKKVFKYDKYLSKNVTKGFLEFVLDRLVYKGLKNIDIPQFPENLQTMIISTIDAIKHDVTGDSDKLYKQIEELQAERDDALTRAETAQKQTQWLYGFMGEHMDVIDREKLIDYLGGKDSEAWQYIKENCMYKLTEDDTEHLTSIKEMVK